MNLMETGKIKRDTYFETGRRYYNQLEAEYFREISDDQFARFMRSDQPKPKKIAPPPNITETRLLKTVRYSMVDLLLLCFLAVVLITVAFLKFFSVDI